MTFRSAAVQAQLRQFALLSVDIGQQQNSDFCKRWKSNVGIPSYTLIDPASGMSEEGIGFLEAAPFLERIGKMRSDLEAKRTPPAGPKALAPWLLNRGDIVGAEAAVLDAAKQHPEDQTWAEDTTWKICEWAWKRERWEDAQRSSGGFLSRFPGSTHRDEATLLRGTAQFHLTGEVGKDIEDGAKPFLATLSSRCPASEPAAWCSTINKAMRTLAMSGEPVANTLLQRMEGNDPEEADHAATTIGWMRCPRTKEVLIQRLADKAKPAISRKSAATGMECWGDQDFLGPLLKVCGDEKEALPLRGTCACAIAQIVFHHGAIHDEALADALMRGAEQEDLYLRSWALEALFAVKGLHEPGRLLPLMADTRLSGAGQKVCDLACSVYLQAMGKKLIRKQDGKNMGTPFSPAQIGAIAHGH